jgi:hypothetical protein
MKVIYEFCKSAQDQSILQQAEAGFFNKIKDDARIELLTYYPNTNQFMTWHEGIPSTRYWQASEFTFIKP